MLTQWCAGASLTVTELTLARASSSEEEESPLLLSDSVSFAVPSGGILVVAGPSGCGKTTLLRTLAALTPVSPAGALALDGEQFDARRATQWRADCVYVPQTEHGRLPGTPSDFHSRVRTYRAHRARAQSSAVAFADIAAELGLGPDVLAQPWRSLSGGQAQRAALANALALGPRVLLLDEPCSALDAVSTARVERLLRQSGATVVLVSHDPEAANRLEAQRFDFESSG